MKVCIIIPAHNEEAYLAQTLDSLCKQSHPPHQLIVVNDHSTDRTQSIIEQFAQDYPFVYALERTSTSDHQPGSKVIRAFEAGLELLDPNYDLLCKYDADLIFPSHYLETLVDQFNQHSQWGIAGGFCTIEKNGSWEVENLTNSDHVRGALKAYRRACFTAIGGLKTAMGWDTIDELLAQYHGWKVGTIPGLHVKHLKPTGANYKKNAGYRQGQAFKQMRYGLLLGVIASAKLALKKRSFRYGWQCLRGLLTPVSDYLVTPEEGSFIRSLRWRNIRRKISG